ISTAGDHMAAAGAASFPRAGRNVSSNSWFILSWIADSSLNGSTQRMIAIVPSLSDGPRGLENRLVLRLDRFLRLGDRRLDLRDEVGGDLLAVLPDRLLRVVDQGV